MIELKVEQIVNKPRFRTKRNQVYLNRYSEKRNLEQIDKLSNKHLLNWSLTDSDQASRVAGRVRRSRQVAWTDSWRQRPRRLCFFVGLLYYFCLWRSVSQWAWTSSKTWNEKRVSWVTLTWIDAELKPCPVSGSNSYLWYSLDRFF